MKDMADTLNKGLHIRPAVHGDSADVTRINDNILMGMDYMPTRYHEFLRIKGAITCVAEVDSRVVGFLMDFPIFSGTAWMEIGGRVHPDYQKRRILPAMMSYLKAKKLQRIPTASLTYYARGMTKEQLKILRFPGSDTVVDIRHWFLTMSDIADVEKALASIKLPPSVKACMDNTKEVTLHNMHRYKLSFFLPGIFYTGDMFVNENTETSIKASIAASTTFVTSTETGDILGVSFVTSSSVRVGSRSVFHFYGTDSAVLKAHLVMQSQAAVTISCATKLAFLVGADRNIPAQGFTDFMERHLALQIVLKEEREVIIVVKRDMLETSTKN